MSGQRYQALPLWQELHNRTTSFATDMECEICKRNPIDDGVVLHRVNEKGVNGIWRCDTCLTPEQRASRDPVVDDIVKIIEQDNRDKT